MIVTDYTRTDCKLGNRRITYNRLSRDYRCNECGGHVTTRYDDNDGWHPECAKCGSRDFVHEAQLRREQVEAQEVLECLPDELLEALGYEVESEREPELFPLGPVEQVEI
jgi:DNA-directed RNA polymerase subunit RPC12/RpoP